MNKSGNRCRTCLLPAGVSGSRIDSEGICRLCREFTPDNVAAENERAARQDDLERALKDCRGRAEYDAVVCLSGGKDSLYLLYKLVTEYKLRVLAFTTDANIPAVAWKSIRRTVDRLAVDHLIYRPDHDFYRRLFRFLLRNQEERGAVYTVSYVYAPLFEGDALRVATERGIPLVLAGYSPGQPEEHRMVYEFSRELVCDTDWVPPYLKACGEFSSPELSRFWNPKRYGNGKSFPRYIAPFHAWPYNQELVMREVVRNKLVAAPRHANPVVSNYSINWLLMYSDLRQFGYNPYAPEFSALIREGKASRRYWRLMAPVVDTMISKKILLGREVKKAMTWLDLSDSDLRITQPQGAYDPPRA